MDLPTSVLPQPSRATEGSGPLYRKTGPEHFSPLADLHTPADQIPPCVKCGKPSFGAVIRDQAAQSVQGCPVLDLEFWCQMCAYWSPYNWDVHSSALYPYYHHVSGMGSQRTYRRLSREEAMQRVGAGR